MRLVIKLAIKLWTKVRVRVRCLLFTPVIPEVVLSSESLVTDITCIWPLICVRSLVY